MLERFAPAGVVEFYASTEGEVVLANVSGKKIGAMGRPLPGSAGVKIAAIDLEKGLEATPSGFARECDTNEVGVLVAEVDPDVNASLDTPLRGVFRRTTPGSPRATCSARTPTATSGCSTRSRR